MPCEKDMFPDTPYSIPQCLFVYLYLPETAHDLPGHKAGQFLHETNSNILQKQCMILQTVQSFQKQVPSYCIYKKNSQTPC